MVTADPQTFERMKEDARRDDWHLRFVGSDIRQMLGEIERLRAAAKEIEMEARIAAGLSRTLLSKLDWKPSRAHFETSKNTFDKIADDLSKLCSVKNGDQS